ncbi:hypothetical protein LTR28_003376 [Elasticomyces elasticus]|nr:hypothetical protein LTR28_003376 [Elasticomyces elasticus]
MHRWLSGNDESQKRGRIVLEESATDSYQNLLFSILAFRRIAGKYPRTVTVITHAFKERRFLELHAKAIHWPPHRIRLQGINPPFSAVELAEAVHGEQTRGYGAFERDLYGAGGVLAAKRKARNWDEEKTFPSLCQGVEGVVQRLLRWTGGSYGNEIFPEKLPWEDDEDGIFS